MKITISKGDLIVRSQINERNKNINFKIKNYSVVLLAIVDTMCTQCNKQIVVSEMTYYILLKSKIQNPKCVKKNL